MDIWIVEHGKYVLYKRTGECKRCGLCCCKNVIDTQVQLAEIQPEDKQRENDNEPDEDLSAWEGWSAFRAQALWFWIKFNVHDELREEACGALVAGKCSEWKGYDFPAVCRYWPVHPSDLAKFPECGFSFERVEHDNRQVQDL